MLDINEQENNAPCCSCSTSKNQDPCTKDLNNTTLINQNWIIGSINTPAGLVPQVSTSLTFDDILGSWKARWGLNRMNYKVNPGLYCVGHPDSNSPVLVTANYKMSFDRLRKELSGTDVWIVVLDTKGINVWCAAGKGTFGTEELIKRILEVKLQNIVSHKQVIVPQLGAPGISAYSVKKHCGFNVIYGPIRASDIKEFLVSGMKATTEMRTVKFSLWDRLVLTPMELVGSIKASLIIFGILFILNLLGIGPFGIIDFYSFIGALLIGCVLTPVLLPWIPGRAFAWKGWLLGFIWAVAVNILNGWLNAPSYSWLRAISYLLLLPPISAFYAMNFTGASTYTSLSGVVKEMKIAIPAIIASLVLGTVLLLVNSFIII